MSISKRAFEVHQKRATPAERLEQAHRHVRSALSEIASDSAPSWETLDDVARSLVAALRDLEALQITLAVIERQERMMSRCRKAEPHNFAAASKP